MKLGLVVDGHPGFISDLQADWQAHYETAVFAFREIELPLSKGRVNHWRLERALRQFVKENDVLFFEWAGPYLIVASRMRSRRPIIVRLHSWELHEFAGHINWNNVDQVILVSHAMQRRFSEMYPDQSHKTRVVHNGVQLPNTVGSNHWSVCNIAMLGELIPVKRVYEAILGVHELRRQGRRINLHVGGRAKDGSSNARYFLSLQRAVKELSLQDAVIFHGWIDDVSLWLSEMDMFVSNSYWEGQQVALLEAMASGCYCLSHFWDGAEEVLPPENIYVTESELQQKIIEYLELPSSEKRSRQEAMRTIASAKFDIERTKREIRSIIDEVAASTVL